MRLYLPGGLDNHSFAHQEPRPEVTKGFDSAANDHIHFRWDMAVLPVTSLLSGVEGGVEGELCDPVQISYIGIPQKYDLVILP